MMVTYADRDPVTLGRQRSSASINREALRQFACACLDFGFDSRIARVAVLGQAVQGFGDQLADLFEFGDPKTA